MENLAKWKWPAKSSTLGNWYDIYKAYNFEGDLVLRSCCPVSLGAYKGYISAHSLEYLVHNIAGG